MCSYRICGCTCPVLPLIYIHIICTDIHIKQFVNYYSKIVLFLVNTLLQNNSPYKALEVHAQFVVKYFNQPLFSDSITCCFSHSLPQFWSLIATAVSLFANCRKWGMWRNQSHLTAVLWRGVRKYSVTNQQPSTLACTSCLIWIKTATNGNISDVPISSTGEGPLS